MAEDSIASTIPDAQESLTVLHDPLEDNASHIYFLFLRTLFLTLLKYLLSLQRK